MMYTKTDTTMKKGPEELPGLKSQSRPSLDSSEDPSGLEPLNADGPYPYSRNADHTANSACIQLLAATELAGYDDGSDVL